MDVDEPYVPLLQNWRKLERVEVTRWDNTNGTQPLDLLALANLPALRTLHVASEEGLLRTRHLKELTQLGSLVLLHALPEDPVLPDSLTCLELISLAVDGEAAVAGPITARMMEDFPGRLGKLVMHGCLQLYNNDPGRFSGLACLQQLRHLSLDFQDCSTDVCHLAFPQLQDLSISLSASARHPRWDLSGCPALQHAKLRIRNGSQQRSDLRRVVGLRAERFELDFAVYSPARMCLSADRWTLGSVQIISQPTAPAANWQACRPHVQDVLRGLLGVVPFSKITVDGVVASTFVG